MSPPEKRKIGDYSNLEPEAQETIMGEVNRVITENGIDWQKFEEVQRSEEKSGPPMYATNEIFDALENAGILSLKEGYGVYELQRGSLINIGPGRNIFAKYNFLGQDELKRYISACYGEAQYQTMAVHSKSIITI